MKQLVKPRTWVTDGAGWCHRMARAVFNAPWVEGLSSATAAADVTKYRHTTRQMPNVAVPVWFWHYGTYGGVTGEFGHVVVWVPGRGFLTSPWYLAHGQEWYSTLEEIERTFNAKFRFWSEDINGLRVVSPATPASPEPEPIYRKGKGREAMIYIYDKESLKAKGGRRWGVFVLGQKGSWWEFRGETAGPMLEKQIGKAMAVSKAVFDERKKAHA